MGISYFKFWYVPVYFRMIVFIASIWKALHFFESIMIWIGQDEFFTWMKPSLKMRERSSCRTNRKVNGWLTFWVTIPTWQNFPSWATLEIYPIYPIYPEMMGKSDLPLKELGFFPPTKLGICLNNPRVIDHDWFIHQKKDHPRMIPVKWIWITLQQICTQIWKTCSISSSFPRQSIGFPDPLCQLTGEQLMKLEAWSLVLVEHVDVNDCKCLLIVIRPILGKRMSIL